MPRIVEEEFLQPYQHTSSLDLHEIWITEYGIRKFMVNHCSGIKPNICLGCCISKIENDDLYFHHNMFPLKWYWQEKQRCK